MIGPLELIIVVFVIFLLLGPKRITNLFKALGRSAKDFTDEFGREEGEKKELPGEETPDEQREKPPRDRP